MCNLIRSRPSPDPPAAASGIFFLDTLVADREAHGEYRVIRLVESSVEWLAENLCLPVGRVRPFCGERSWDAYDAEEEELPVDQYYTWRAALQAAARFGDGWRLPSVLDFQHLHTALKQPENRQAPFRKLRLHHGGWRGCTGDRHWSSWQGAYWTSEAAKHQHAYCCAFRTSPFQMKVFSAYRRNAYAVRLLRSR